MLRETKTGHYESDLSCPNGHRGPWQPTDRDPCLDDWWCRTCQEWFGGLDLLKVGDYPWKRHRIKNGVGELVNVCQY